MKPIRRVLERVLAFREPYPWWVGSRGFRFISSNRAAEAPFSGMCSMSPEAIVELWFGPGPFRDLVENWQDVAWAGVAALRREAVRASDPALTKLLRRAEGHAKAIPTPERDARPELPVICPRLNIAGRRVSTISTVMRFDTAIEVTASELKIELMFPADDESERYVAQPPRQASRGREWQPHRQSAIRGGAARRSRHKGLEHRHPSFSQSTFACGSPATHRFTGRPCPGSKASASPASHRSIALSTESFTTSLPLTSACCRSMLVI